MYNVLPTLKKSSSRCHCNHTSSLMQLTLTDCSLKQMWGRSTPALLNQSHLYTSPVVINIIFVSFLNPSLFGPSKFKQGLIRGLIFISCQQLSQLSNNCGGWNKRGGWDFLEKLVHNSNKRGVEGGKI